MRIVKATREGEAAVIAATKAMEARKKEAEGEMAFLDATTLHVAQNPTAAKIAAISVLPKTLTTLVQEGAVNVEIGKKEKK